MFKGNYLVSSGKRSRIADRFAPKKAKASLLAKSVKTARRMMGRSLSGRARSEVAPSPLNQVIVVPMELRQEPILPVDHTGEADSILSLYMREAGEVPLLTPKEEIALAARIQRSDAAAREHMIRANLRFVIKIAREYEHLGMPLLDLINEGNIGLMKAVEKFDPAKGGKFSTYAVLWIKQQIRRALASQGKTIRLPIHVADKIYHLAQAEVRLRHQLGREATDEELADELDIKVSRLAKLRRAALRPTSLDAPLGEDSSSTVAELVADDNASTPFEQLRDQMETGMVHQLVAQLSEREARIIRFRFGLDGGEERTLEDVGRKFNLTRERIRQLQNLALQKLRKLLEETPSVPIAA
jgi:RNA polymerase primary sigma factor